MKLLRSSLPSTIDLQQAIDSGCGSVLADPTRIHQVLMNLCTNVKQAMGYQVTPCLDAKEAFSVFLDNPNGIDLVVQSSGTTQ